VKLHSIAVQNLASLYGEHRIDLDRDLGGAPLFLIVGPTGAGKSTLLDAVCLALFGSTPRLPGSRGRAETDAAQVMSHGTGEARAEVVVSTVGGDGARRRYRAVWSCRRAHGRPDGNLQAPQRSLERIDEEGECLELLVSSHLQKEIEPAFETVLEGMAVEDFQRSVLLAQGEFAAFLKAEEDERATILERLTSTEVYRRIGSRAADAWRRSKERVAELEAHLEGVQPLDEAAVAELEATQTAAQTERGRLDAEIAQLDGVARWLADGTRQAETREGLAERRRQWVDERSRAAPQLARLAEDETCRPLEEPLQRVVDLEARTTAERRRIRDDERRHRQLAAELVASGRRRRELVEARLERGRALLDAVATEHAEAVGSLDLAREELTARRAAAGRAAEGAERAARGVVGDQALEAPEAPAPREVRRAFAAERARWSARSGVLDRLDVLAAEGARIGQERAGRNDQRDDRRRELERIVDRLADLERQHGAARALVRERRSHLDTLRTVLGLSHHRRDLAPGEPCPLCGSTEHPHRTSGELDAQDRELEAKSETLTAALAAGEAERDRLATRRQEVAEDRVRAEAALERLADDETQAGGRLEEISEERRRLTAELGLDPEPPSVPEEPAPQGDLFGSRGEPAPETVDLDALRRVIGRHLAEIDQRADAFEGILQAAGEASTAAERAATAVAEARSRLADLDARRKRFAEGLEALGEERRQVDRERAAEEARLREELGELPDVPPSDLSPEDGPEPAGEELRQRARQAADSWAEGLAALDRLRGSQTAARARLGELDDELAEARERLGEGLAEAGLDSREALVDRLLGDEERSRLAALRRRLDHARAELDALDRQAAQAAADHGRAQPRELSAVWAGTTDDEADEASPPPAFDASDEVAGWDAETRRRVIRVVDRLEARTAELRRQRDEAVSAAARASQSLADHEKRLERLAGLGRALDEARAEHRTWSELHRLIGMRDGEQFKRFAQIANLEELVERANRHLESLAPRYSLAVAHDDDGRPRLAFVVRDADLASVERHLTNLSGGETFLVSLALALALADTRDSGFPIETLLLDEGFGTLDPRSLETVMETLERLHARSSTQIGLISHVEALKERVEARIVVEKLGSGRSTVGVELGAG
jgi:exonuclease SbcC